MSIKPGVFVLALTVAFAAAAANADEEFVGSLSGAAESPPVVTPGSGSQLLTVSGSSLDVAIDFSGLTGNTTAAHVHCCIAPPANVGVAVTLTGFPLGVTAGSYQHAFDLTSSATYGASFLTTFGGGTAAGAQAALLAGLRAGTAYVNVHTIMWPGGEIRANSVAVLFRDGFENGNPLAWSFVNGWN